MEKTKKVLNEEQIIDVMSKVFGFDTLDVLYRKSRKRELTDCRQLIMYFLRKYVPSKTKRNEPISFQAIGRHFKKHHATIIHAIETVEGMAETNKEYRSKLQEYDNMLYRLGSEHLCVFCNRPLEYKPEAIENCYV